MSPPQARPHSVSPHLNCPPFPAPTPSLPPVDRVRDVGEVGGLGRGRQQPSRERKLREQLPPLLRNARHVERHSPPRAAAATAVPPAVRRPGSRQHRGKLPEGQPYVRGDRVGLLVLVGLPVLLALGKVGQAGDLLVPFMLSPLGGVDLAEVRDGGLLARVPVLPAVLQALLRKVCGTYLV